jgi:hypothetical protein
VNHNVGMQDKTINNALLALRKQIIRGDGKGLAQAETLLRMRGVVMPRVLPAKRKDVARKGQMSKLVLDALRGGPMTTIEVADHVARNRPELAPEAAKKRAGLCLTKLKRRGLVGREWRVWMAL